MSKFAFVEPQRHALAMEICEKAGIDPNMVRRIVIDLQIGDAGMVYLETFADDSILDVQLSKVGVEVVERTTA